MHVPRSLDYAHLVDIERPDPAVPELFVGPAHDRRERLGFSLTDRRMRRREVEAEIDYCLLCHDRDKDSCSKGMVDAKAGAFKKNPLGIPLTGCPLEEKISEMHAMRQAGELVAAHGPHRRRQPYVPGDWPPHLQRLHEGVHLPEAGAGEHPGGRDAGADRDAGLAVGARGLPAADPLEPAQRPPPLHAPVQRQEGARGGPRSGRIHAGAPPRVRGVRHRRGRWAEGRASRPRARGHFHDGAPAGEVGGVSLRRAPGAQAAGLRRGQRVRHHRSLGQELPHGGLPHPGPQPAHPHVRRHSFRGHHHAGRRVGHGGRPRGDPRPAPAAPPSSR